VNPKLPYGGMFNDNKSQIYELMPSEWVPKTTKVEPQDSMLAKFQESGLDYPFIVKPDIGFAGAGIFLIENRAQLEELAAKPRDLELILQEYIQLEREFSVMFHNIEVDGKPFFTLIEKRLPYVIGDGTSTLLELIHNSENKKIRKEIILERFESSGNRVLPKGETMIIDYVGAISKGSVVIQLPVDHTDPLYNKLQKVFISQDINFARVDVKAKSLEALRAGEFVMMEVNGAKSEPLEMYIDALPLSVRLKILSRHWKHLSILSKRQKKKGFIPNTQRECIQGMVEVNREMKKVKKQGFVKLSTQQ